MAQDEKIEYAIVLETKTGGTLYYEGAGSFTVYPSLAMSYPTKRWAKEAVTNINYNFNLGCYYITKTGSQ